MDKVALMNRVDRKFLLPFADLHQLIPSLQAYYRILTINGQHVFTYKTIISIRRADNVHWSS